MEKHNQLLQLAKANLGELSTIPDQRECDQEEIQAAYEQVCNLVKKLEVSIDKTKDDMLDEEEPFESIMSWNNKQKDEMKPFKELRTQLKQQLGKKQEEEEERLWRKEMEKNKLLNEQAMQTRLNEQKELEEAAKRRIKQEEEWVMRKLQLEKEAHEQPVQQAVKLQRYTITPFNGEYKDWIRFWNQFDVEVDRSNLAQVSKFNYLLEYTKGKAHEDILGLPHNAEGYDEAKRILQTTYGKDVKVHKAIIKEIESLHTITSTHKVESIHEFYNKLSRAVRALTTMKKLNTAQSMVYTLLDKLGPVREAMAQTDDKWEEWKLEDLTETLRKYVDRNPLTEKAESRCHEGSNREQRSYHKDRVLFNNTRSNQNQAARRQEDCVYCKGKHKSSDCAKVLTVANRKEILKKNRLCYNCTRQGHSAANCRSRNCFKCGQKHHTSICTKQESTLNGERSETAHNSASPEFCKSAFSASKPTLHAAVKATVNGQDVRIMIDTGASTSYVCSDLITKLAMKPVRREQRTIEQMYGTVSRRVDIYKVNIESQTEPGYNLDVECIHAEKGVLTYLPNPNIRELKSRFKPLEELQIADENATSDQLPVHIILGAADYQRIRTTQRPILGNDPDQDPGAEFTKLGWVLYGKAVTEGCFQEKQFLSCSKSEFERLCSLDVLGLVEQPSKQTEFHEDFIQHLERTTQGHYETRLPWKPDHSDLPTNKDLTAARLKNVTRRLEKVDKLADYHEIMQQQVSEGILEPVPQEPTGEIVHYLPHQPVIRQDAESTKLRIVYDCSAKQSTQMPALNDCLETGPTLQPLLFDIILRNRMRTNCLTGDIKSAFLQILVNEQDRDAQRTLWYNNIVDRQLVEYRFTRVIFGSTASPYILGATLQKHVGKYEAQYPSTVKALLEDTYVDDIQCGGDSIEELQQFKSESENIMADAGFTLHKWHSNKAELEEAAGHKEASTGSSTNREPTKLLGISWNKDEDELQIGFQSCLEVNPPVTKRKVLAAINGVYDILGWASPVTILGKILFSELCSQKVSWDEEVEDSMTQRWNVWTRGLRKCLNVTVPRSVLSRDREQLTMHGFSDASKLAVCAAVYVQVIYNDGGADRNLLVAKSRIAPKEVSIPRLELVAAHTLAKLISNVVNALAAVDTQEIHLWSDSTTVLHWLESKGTWSKYVRNRVKAIKELGEFVWHYVPTDQNPSDLGTRGVEPSNLGEFWFKGPKWLTERSAWPEQPQIAETKETLTEVIPCSKEKLLLGQDDQVQLEKTNWRESLLKRYKYWKLLRVTAYLLRFVNNCRSPERKIGALTTSEITLAENCWIKIAQEDGEMDCPVELKVDEIGILRCHGRVPQYHPAFIPRDHPVAALIVARCHEDTLHGGVQSTMCKVRKRYWIPQLRRKVKSNQFKCNKCRKVRAKALPQQPVATLPACRAELTEPFSTTGVDFAGPLLYKMKNKKVAKAYVVLFTCSSSRAVHLKLCKNQSANEFKKTLKEFVARRGSPRLLISDNAKTFVAMKKWLKTLENDDEVNDYLASQVIKWKFNLARAPWWGGFFERLIGIMKQAMSKVIGKAMLTFSELEEVMLDIECFMNNRPLTYLGEEFEGLVITPNILLRGTPATLLKEREGSLDETTEVTKRMKYLRSCQKQMRKRWINEYLRALDEKQKRKKSQVSQHLPAGRVVLIKDALTNNSQWRIAKVEGKIKGKDGVIRGYKVRTGNGYLLERPVQLIANLEIGGEATTNSTVDQTLNPKAPEFVPRRPTRVAKETARNRIVGLTLNENEEQ